METWWQGLGFVNQLLFSSAIFFSLLFIWQLISTIMGLDSGDHGDMAMDGLGDADDIPDIHGDIGAEGLGDADDASNIQTGSGLVHGGHVGDTPIAHADDLAAGQVTYSLVTIRSIIAFGTLFSWASAIFLASGYNIMVALLIGLIWGALGMFLVSFALYKLVQMQEIGTRSTANAIGEEGIVYINIPAKGSGQVRVICDGAVSFINATSKTGAPISAGSKVRVVGLADERTLEVEEINLI